MNEVAKILLDCAAVNLNPNQPFTLTSGKKSPVYVDCRRLIAFPAARQAIIKEMAAWAKPFNFNVIAGGETAGIPYAAWLAEALNLPMAYIRKKPKGFGRNQQIEGVVNAGDNVLLVEDLATDGGSKVVFVDAMRAAGLTVQHSVVVFSYGIFESPLTAMGVSLHGLATWHDVMAVVEAEKRLTTAEIEVVNSFLANPTAWQEKHRA